MLQTLLKTWWVLILRGILILLFTIMCALKPDAAISSYVISFSIFMMVDGGLAIGTSLNGAYNQEDNWLIFIDGMLSVVLGIIYLSSENESVLFISLFMGFWAMISGILRVAMAIQLRKELNGEIWLAASGCVLMLTGFAFITQTNANMANLIYIIVPGGLLSTVILAYTGNKLRRVGKWSKKKSSSVGQKSGVN